MQQFYTYVHCKPNGDPFYVGKGTGRRAYDLVRDNKHHQNVVNKYGADNVGVFIFHCDSEDEALADEVQHIAQLRNEGFDLSNVTAGGDGFSSDDVVIQWKNPLFRLTRTNRIKEAMSTPEAKARNSMSKKGLKKSPEHCAKMSATNIGKRHSTETKAKQSAGIKVALARPEIRNTMGVKGNKHRLGSKATPATKAKMAESQRLRWAKLNKGELK